MFLYMLPIVIVVISNIVYHICQKSTPQTANPFSALLVTYLTAAVLTAIAFCFSKSDKSLLQSFGDLNWTSMVLGIAVIGLEMGFLMAYRVGWNISIGSLAANILLAVILIPVGILIYNEGFHSKQMIGAVFCIIGLILINKY